MSHDLVFYVYLYNRKHDTSRLSGTCGLSSLNNIIYIELGKRLATAYTNYSCILYLCVFENECIMCIIYRRMTLGDRKGLIKPPTTTMTECHRFIDLWFPVAARRQLTGDLLLVVHVPIPIIVGIPILYYYSRYASRCRRGRRRTRVI